jgi:3-phenylpropionate/cinnamic acid dioxygenase small subunit
MTDTDAIRQTLARYWQYLDDRREREWVDLFTDDAVLRYEGAEATSRDALEAIAADLKNHTPGKHLSSNEIIEIDGDSATAHSDVVFLSPAGDGVTIRFYGRCDDTLRRVGASWRFVSRSITFQGGVH